MLDLVHDLNYPSWLLGEALAPKACVIKKLSALKIETEDFAESLLGTKSGVMVNVHQDYVRRPARRSLEIVGEKGSILWDSESAMITVTQNGAATVLEAAVGRNSMYQAEVDFFFASMKNKKYFSNFNEGRQDVVLIEQLKKYAKR
jgi:predicted dehydrogenase